MNGTVVKMPERKSRQKWCQSRCNIMDRSYYTKDVPKSTWPVNTVIKCGECSRMWVVKRTIAHEMIAEPYYVLRPLRWYHRAGWGLDKQEA